jgi:hypothetical protein
MVNYILKKLKKNNFKCSILKKPLPMNREEYTCAPPNTHTHEEDTHEEEEYASDSDDGAMALALAGIVLNDNHSNPVLTSIDTPTQRTKKSKKRTEESDNEDETVSDSTHFLSHPSVADSQGDSRGDRHRNGVQIKQRKDQKRLARKAAKKAAHTNLSPEEMVFAPLSDDEDEAHLKRKKTNGRMDRRTSGVKRDEAFHPGAAAKWSRDKSRRVNNAYD